MVHHPQSDALAKVDPRALGEERQVLWNRAPRTSFPTISTRTLCKCKVMKWKRVGGKRTGRRIASDTSHDYVSSLCRLTLLLSIPMLQSATLAP